MLHAFIALIAVCGVSIYVARSRPATYLQWQDAVAWAIHALWFGFVFGVGVIIGRYGFLDYTSAVIADWIMLYAPVVTSCYVALLLYHTYLRAFAEQRRAYLQRRGSAARWPGLDRAVGVFSRGA